MGKTSTDTKQRYNEAHYVQIKVNAKPEIAAAFKESCKQSGVSMSEVLSQFMAQYPKNATKKRTPTIDTQTRGHRRNSVKTLIQNLAMIRDAEESYMDNIPENLKSSPYSEAADDSIAALGEVIDLLESAY